jgi:diguanylate cyclase (GGDEF)-like protein
LKILIAEDDAVSRTILRRAVEKLGHECLAAADGEEAWGLYKENPDIDTIISDWMMPGVDGLELCRRVRGDGREGYTFFIFLTALGDREHLLQGLEAGADDYLSKPLDRDELGMRLTSALRVTELHRRLAFQNGELEKLNRMLFEQSRQDPLTSLGNRLRLREDLQVLQSRTERYGHNYAVVLLDVDFFKAYNDRYGHEAGNAVLRCVAQALRESARAEDLVARYGGEEFVMLLNSGVEEAAEVAERIRKGVVTRCSPGREASVFRQVTVSVGVASLTARIRTLEDLVRTADEEMYLGKWAGKNMVCVARDRRSISRG